MASILCLPIKPHKAVQEDKYTTHLLSKDYVQHTPFLNITHITIH